MEGERREGTEQTWQREKFFAKTQIQMLRGWGEGRKPLLSTREQLQKRMRPGSYLQVGWTRELTIADGYFLCKRPQLTSSWEPPDTPRTGMKLPAPCLCWHPMAHTVHGHTACSLWKPFLKQQNLVKKKMRTRLAKIKHSVAQTTLPLGKQRKHGEDQRQRPLKTSG